MKTPWAPGPWKESTEPVPPGERSESFMRGVGDANYDDVCDISGASEADFRLIAAAPEMAELLYEALNYIPAMTGLDDDITVLFARIRGEAA